MFEQKLIILLNEYRKCREDSAKENIIEEIKQLVQLYPSYAKEFSTKNSTIPNEIKTIIENPYEDGDEDEEFKKKQKINFKRNFSNYLKSIKPHKIFLIACFLSVIVIQSIVLFEKWLFGFLVEKSSLFSSGDIVKEEFISILIIIAGVYIFSKIIEAISEWIKLHFITKLDENVVYDIKKRFLEHIMLLSHRFHTNHKTGKLISRINRGSFATVAMSGIFIFTLAPVIISSIFIIGSFLYFNIYSAISVFLTLVIFVGYSIFYINKTQDAKVKSNKYEDKENGKISDMFTNIETVKYFGKEKFILNYLLKHSYKVKNANIKLFFYFRNLSAVQSLILGVGTFFVLLFPFLSFLNNTTNLGTITFIYTSYLTLLPPMQRFVNGIRDFYDASGDLEELFNYIDVEQEVKNSAYANPLKITRGSVDFNNVSFSYDSQQILKSINFSINPNETIALVGHSGSGKSTIIKLLYRLYDINNGSIKIDGNDIRDVTQESLRSELSIVPQEPSLFDDTIYNNILFSNPFAKKEEVFDAIKFAQLDEFVEELPKKEKTIVGERGIKLSGGQKQRISIARAILANKKILILDEATSSLDSKTENEIQKDLKKLMENRTSIIIAHRLSTILNADKIIVMDKGVISSIGTHKELLEKSSLYQELWSIQQGNK